MTGPRTEGNGGEGNVMAEDAYESLTRRTYQVFESGDLDLVAEHDDLDVFSSPLSRWTPRRSRALRTRRRRNERATTGETCRRDRAWSSRRPNMGTPYMGLASPTMRAIQCRQRHRAIAETLWTSLGGVPALPGPDSAGLRLLPRRYGPASPSLWLVEERQAMAGGAPRGIGPGQGLDRCLGALNIYWQSSYRRQAPPVDNRRPPSIASTAPVTTHHADGTGWVHANSRVRQADSKGARAHRVRSRIFARPARWQAHHG